MDSNQPAVFTLEAQPDWGFGVLVEEREGKLVLLFEKGGRRVFDKQKVKGLHPALASPEDARALEARLRGRRLPAGDSKAAKPREKRVTPTHASFEEQLRWFEKNFPGGFEGERFITEERGKPGSKRKNGYKDAAMALAREQLSPERFTSAASEELFESARKVLQFTNIIHPLEGAVAFGSMAAEARGPLVAALRELLHGPGDYGPRFERFVETLRIPDAEGKLKRVTWPMATLLAAMYYPTEHVCVKPTCFEAQAPIVGISIEKSQPPSAEGYTRFLEVARATRQRLLDAGHRPRDLMDVYSFIYCSQSGK